MRVFVRTTKTKRMMVYNNGSERASLFMASQHTSKYAKERPVLPKSVKTIAKQSINVIMLTSNQ